MSDMKFNVLTSIMWNDDKVPQKITPFHIDKIINWISARGKFYQFHIAKSFRWGVLSRQVRKEDFLRQNSIKWDIIIAKKSKVRLCTNIIKMMKNSIPSDLLTSPRKGKSQILERKTFPIIKIENWAII